MKLNLGCGKDIREGYENIDLNSTNTKVKRLNVMLLSEYFDKSIEEILAHSVLEHLSTSDLRPALKEWNRVLEVGGILDIEVPNVIGAVRAFLEKRLNTTGFARHYKNWSPEEVVFQMLYGRADILGTNDPIECQHMTGFNYNRLNRFLTECGFEIIKSNDSTDSDQNLNVIAKKIKDVI